MSVSINAYVDEDYATCEETRRSVTRVFGSISVNNSFIHGYCKMSNIVETSTCGSDVVAARITTELHIEIRYKLRLLGIPIKSTKIYIWDNLSVAIRTTTPRQDTQKEAQCIGFITERRK